MASGVAGLAESGTRELHSVDKRERHRRPAMGKFTDV